MNQSFQAEMKVMIRYKSGKACFRIHEESAGIYTACLLFFNGINKEELPKEITLVKGIRNWTGSMEDDMLLSELGEFIDANRP